MFATPIQGVLSPLHLNQQFSLKRLIFFHTLVGCRMVSFGGIPPDSARMIIARRIYPCCVDGDNSTAYPVPISTGAAVAVGAGFSPNLYQTIICTGFRAPALDLLRQLAL
jgi:hypothetical protein